MLPCVNADGRPSRKSVSPSPVLAPENVNVPDAEPNDVVLIVGADVIDPQSDLVAAAHEAQVVGQLEAPRRVHGSGSFRM